MLAVPTLGSIPAPLVHSDALLNPDYGRSVESPFESVVHVKSRFRKIKELEHHRAGCRGGAGKVGRNATMNTD